MKHRNKNQYSKVRFTSKHNGCTSSIILSKAKQESMTITEISRLFPISECMKMERLERGEYYDTFEQAFNSDI